MRVGSRTLSFSETLHLRVRYCIDKVTIAELFAGEKDSGPGSSSCTNFGVCTEWRRGPLSPMANPLSGVSLLACRVPVCGLFSVAVSSALY